MFDFLVLSLLKEGPQSISEIQQRSGQLRLFMHIVAAGTRRLGTLSLLGVLTRLEGGGWLEAERRLDKNGREEIAYSLSADGKQMLAQEAARRSAIVAEFVENSGLEHSFRTFLDGSAGKN